MGEGGCEAEKEAFQTWLLQTTPDSADRYQQVKNPAATVVTEANLLHGRRLERLWRTFGRPQSGSGKPFAISGG